MLDADKCSIKITRIEGDKIRRAYVEFKQDQTRLSGFILKESKTGFFMDAPKLPPEYKYTYFDENKERFKKLREKVIEQYLNETESDGIDDAALERALQEPL